MYIVKLRLETNKHTLVKVNAVLLVLPKSFWKAIAKCWSYKYFRENECCNGLFIYKLVKA